MLRSTDGLKAGDKSGRIKVAASVVTAELMAEIVWDTERNPSPIFAVSGPHGIEFTGAIDGNGILTNPPSDNLVESEVVLLAAKPVAYGTQADLVQDLRRFIHRYADVPEIYEKLMAHYALMTWVYDRFTALPYLRLLGESGTGKTRCQQVVGHLCYKAIVAGGAVTASPLFRLMDLYGGTFVIDEADFKHSEQWSEITKILNCGYQKGSPVLRSAKSGDDYEARAFNAFGPKIIANRAKFGDDATESRCITLQMVEKKIRADVPRQLPMRFYGEALELRNKLLQWRFDRYRGIEADESNLLSLDPRVTQIATPLYVVSEDPVFRKELIGFVGDSSSALKLEKPQAIVVEAVRRLYGWADKNKGKEEKRKFTVGAVADEATRELTEDDEKMTARATGRLLRSLGIKPERTKTGYRFEVSRSEVDELVERYHIPDEEKAG